MTTLANLQRTDQKIFHPSLMNGMFETATENSTFNIMQESTVPLCNQYIKWESNAVQPLTDPSLVASGKQLHSYSGNTLSPLNDYWPIRKGLLVCHKH